MIPPGCSACSACFDDAPRFGEVEEDAVEVVEADAVVDVADLDVERHVGAEEPLDVGAGATGEVVADLVAGDAPVLADRSEQREA